MAVKKKRMPKKKFAKFVKKAIKRPGALSARAKSQGKSTAQEAQANLKSGTPLQKKQAVFFLNFLKGKSKRSRSQSLLK